LIFSFFLCIIIIVCIEKKFYLKFNRFLINMTPNILTYIDYRHYLIDLYEAMKKVNPRLSYREFGRMAGSPSPNFLQFIRDRKLNIHPSEIGAIAGKTDMSRKEEMYFETIAGFDHAKTHEEKDRFFRRMLSAREFGPIRQLDKTQYEYFSHWYIPVIREILVSPGCTGDAAWIARKIVPEVSVAKVKKGVKLIESLGVAVKNPDGSWSQRDSAISTPSQVFSLAITKYHRDSIQLGREAIDRFAPADRDIRSVTLGVSQDGANEVKERLESFWKELLAFAGTQKSVEKVIQVNLQMFPMTHTKGTINDTPLA
jgi:uncharacterized protein (TIGR02147 family)